MIAHQKPRLLEFLRKKRSMKLNIRTEALFEKPECDDGSNEIGSQELVYALPSTRFNTSNEDELTQALEDSVKQILLQIQNLEASTSNLRFKKILSITIHGWCLVYVNHATWPDYDVDVKVVAHGDYVKIAVPPTERFQCPTCDDARLSQQGLAQNEIEDVVLNEDAQAAYSPSMLSSDEMRALAVDRVVTDDESSNDVHSMLQTVRSSHDHECGTDQVCKEISRLHIQKRRHITIPRLFDNERDGGAALYGQATQLMVGRPHTPLAVVSLKNS